jgi:type I restriction enzyme, S subunit
MFPTAKLGPLATKVGSGATPRGGASVYTDDGVAFIRSQNVLDFRMKLDDVAHLTDDAAHALRGVTVEPDDVLLNITGDSIARCCVVEAVALPARVSQHVAIIRTTKDLHSKFLQYALLEPAFKRHLIAISDGGGTRKALTKAMIEGLDIPLPLFAEQQAIAEVLGALDDKIAANTQAAKTTDELIEAHYVAATSAEGAASQLLFDVLDIVFGEAFKGDSFSEPGVGRPLIRIRDLKTASPQVWTTEARPRETLIQAGDVVVGMDAEFRASWWLGEPGLLNQRVLRATAKGASTAFAAMALKQPLAALEGEKSATTVIHLNKSDLERSSVMVPGVAALARFDAVAEPLRLARVALALENRKLAETRDEFLPLLMSGKVRVKDAEKTVEGVL